MRGAGASCESHRLLRRAVHIGSMLRAHKHTHVSDVPAGVRALTRGAVNVQLILSTMIHCVGTASARFMTQSTDIKYLGAQNLSHTNCTPHDDAERDKNNS